VCSTLGKIPELQIVGEVSDGLEAVQKAEKLRPDLIVLDIGLPSLNGIEAARQILGVSSGSKILFVSQEFSADVVQEALDTGGHGYVLKTDAGSELLEGVNAVLRGEQFVGRRFARHDFVTGTDEVGLQEFRTKIAFPRLRSNAEIAHRHEAGFYSDDAGLLDDLTSFIGAALRAGNAGIVLATESHRERVLPRLRTHGLDVAAAIQQGRYIALDAAETLSTFMVDGMPDAARFLQLFTDLILTVSRAANAEHPRVAVFGECVNLLWSQGNGQAAVQVEQLGNQLAKRYAVDILCGYSLHGFQGGIHSCTFQEICAEHSAVYSR